MAALIPREIASAMLLEESTLLTHEVCFIRPQLDISLSNTTATTSWSGAKGAESPLPSPLYPSSASETKVES